ncbi:SRPBCC domain-containing protein [uncultured Ruegeria sp.]|uniref:SRPBCC family protein n=1 Tax=uncultured Ruegeria sp. TaxID=259304 RepID=UPI002629A0EC|nr:SRPBCC domain-containing protein [uncultured Ruegeria sp.]
MTKPLIVRREIPASQAEVFDAFSCVEKLTSWFKPNSEMTVKALEFQIKHQGRFRLQFVTPKGGSPIVVGTFLNLRRPEFIEMSWEWQAPDPLEGVPMKIAFCLGITDVGTEVVLTHTGNPSENAFTIHEDGWIGTLKNLESYLQA